MCAYVLYVVAINVFLSTSLFDRVVNGDPITLDIHFAKGWSLFPGTIHAEQLSIRSSDSNVEWLLTLDKVEFDVSVLALPQRRFQVDRARGSGISMRVHQKRMAWPETTEEIANLAPIPGFAAFNVSPAGPPHPERWDDEQYKLITVLLEDVVAEDVREIWIDDVRFAGHARIEGRFYLKPIRGVDIGPCHIGIESGQVNLGFSRAIATDIAGTLDVTADRFDPREVHDNEALRYFTVATELRARSAPLASLPFPTSVYADGIIDARKIALRIDHGRLVPGTQLEAGTSRLYLARDGYMGEGALDVRATVAHEPDGDRLRGETSLGGIRVMRSDTTELLEAARVYLRADSAKLDLGGPEAFTDLHVGAELDEAAVADARVANCIVPCAVRFHAGSATLNARADAWPNAKRMGASARLAYADMHASTADVDARGNGEVTASVGSFRWDTGVMEGVNLASNFRDAKVISSTSPFRRGELRAAAIGLKVARVDTNDPLAALDASINVTDESAVDVDLFVANKRLRASGNIGADAHVSFASHELTGYDARVHAPNLQTQFGELFARAGVEGTANSDTPKAHHARVALSKIGVGRSGQGITAHSAVVTLHAAPNVLDIDARIDGGRVRDPAAIASLLPKSVALTSNDGAFRGDAKIAVHGDVMKARVNAATRALGVRTEKLTLTGDANVAVDLRRYDGKTISLGPSKVTIADVRGPLGTARSIEIDGSAKSIELENPSLESVDGHLALDGVEMPDARVLQAFLSPKSKLRITSGALAANGDIQFSGSSSASGTIAVDARHAGIAIDKSTLDGDFAFRARVTGIDAAATSLDLSGTTLALRNIEVKNAAAETRGWSANVVLDDTKVGWAGGDPSIGSNILLTADDARPVLGILVRDHAPKVLMGLVTMPNLALRGRFDADPEEIALTDFYIKGGDVAIRGSYAIRDEKPRGAFVLSKSGIAVGVRIGDDGAHPRFFGLDTWLREEEKNVKAKH